MKKSLLIILLAMTLSSCFTTTYMVDGNYKLKDANANYGVGLINDGAYFDEYVTLMPSVTDSKIDLVIINQHTSSIRVLWDNAAFIDGSGFAQRVIHTGVKLIDKDKAQVPSVIPAGSRITDVVVPVDGIEFTNGDWTYLPFIKRSFNDLESAENLLSLYNTTPAHSQITLLLPIEVDDRKIEYTMIFEGEKFQITSSETVDQAASMKAVYGWSIGASILTILLTLVAI